MADEKIDSLKQIKKHIQDGNNFVLNGGAGSGKTRSLTDVLDFLYEQNPENKIACITFTNVASDEITERMSAKSIKLRSSTIHDFLWDMMKTYQKNIKTALLELIASGDIKYDGEDSLSEEYFLDKSIDYREWRKIEKGIISHDEVLKLANKLFKDQPLLRKILGDKYDYILIDEYQDTEPQVIQIFLDFLQEDNSPIIGLFGDSMQSIYEKGIGSLADYIDSGKVKEVLKEDNWRCAKNVISLINKVRNDGLQQNPAGKNIVGKVSFLYTTQNEFNIQEIKQHQIFKDFDFSDYKENKELYLTHRLIAKQFGFENLLASYKYKDSLTGDNPDKLTSHLFKIQEIITLYKENKYNEFLKRTDYRINKESDLITLKENIVKLETAIKGTIDEAIELADKLRIVTKDDKLNDFIQENNEQYEKVKDISYDELVNLFEYRDQHSPYSTQHGVKGAEFENVFVILDNGKWNQYNFDYLFENRADKESIVERTRKIFYVCCSRVKNNLVVFYPEPTASVLNQAKGWFGAENCIQFN